jgi:hypothetical protein
VVAELDRLGESEQASSAARWSELELNALPRQDPRKSRIDRGSSVKAGVGPGKRSIPFARRT